MSSGTLKYIDISIDENDIAKGAVEVLKHLRPSWKEENIKFLNFTEGITNKLIGCYQTSDTKKEDGIVMRVYGAKTELLIDRDAELLNMQVLHAAGCAAPCYARFKNGIAYGFVPGQCLDEVNVRDPVVYKCVTRSMAALHLVQPDKLGLTTETGEPISFNKQPCLFPKLRKFLALAPDSFEDPEKDKKLKRIMPNKAYLGAEIDRMEREVVGLGSPVLFCHNDLLLKNIVYQEQKGTASFIDYEYGAYNYEAFDIGNHFAEWAGVDDLDFGRYPTREEQLPWLRLYLEQKRDLNENNVQVTDSDVEQLYLQANRFALLGHLFWGIWGLIQAAVSTIDFDYLDYAQLKLGEYFARRDEFLAIQMPQ